MKPMEFHPSFVLRLRDAFLGYLMKSRSSVSKSPVTPPDRNIRSETKWLATRCTPEHMLTLSMLGSVWGIYCQICYRLLLLYCFVSFQSFLNM